MNVDELKKMTVAELREEAKKLGDVTGIAAMKKDDLVQLLSSGAQAGAAPSAGQARGKRGPMTRSDLKQKIRALKRERASAGQRMAKSKVEEFNSQLRRYRRRLRRAARHKAT